MFRLECYNSCRYLIYHDIILDYSLLIIHLLVSVSIPVYRIAVQIHIQVHVLSLVFERRLDISKACCIASVHLKPGVINFIVHRADIVVIYMQSAWAITCPKALDGVALFSIRIDCVAFTT